MSLDTEPELTDLPDDDEPERLPARREVVTDEDLGTLIPLRDEMRGMAQLAVTLAAADVLPSALRKKPADVLAIILTGRELGVGPMTAIRNFHVIKGVVTIAPKFKVAQVHKRGLGRVYPHQPPRPNGDTVTLCPCGMDDGANDDQQAMWHAERNDVTGIVYTSVYTMQMATNADLVEKDNWKAYPERMLSWRALGYLIDDAFAEIGTGLYMPDELGAVTDEDGLPVLDVKSTESLVAGPKAPPAPPIQPDVLADFQRRISNLTDTARADLLVAYKARDLPKLDALLHSQQKLVDAMIVVAEKQAKTERKTDPEPDTPPVAPESTETPLEASLTASTPEDGWIPPFDPDGLPDGHEGRADSLWADRAPDDWVSEAIDEVTTLEAAEVKSRAKAFALSTSGGDPAVRARLTARIVRRRMEKALTP